MKLSASFWYVFVCISLLHNKGSYAQVPPQQCLNPEYYYRDADGDNFGSQDFDQEDLDEARVLFIEEGVMFQNLCLKNNR